MHKKSNIISELMFDFEDMNRDLLNNYMKSLSQKELRWLGANHIDNRLRKLFFRNSNIEIGKDTVINQNFIVSDDYKKLLKIGDRVAISPNVTIICSSSPNNSILANNKEQLNKVITSKKVVIKDDVWIGSGVIILPGVKIGKGTIVGAGSVVSKSLDSFSIYYGSPAKKSRAI